MKARIALLIASVVVVAPGVLSANQWTAEDLWSTGALSFGPAPLVKIDAAFPSEARDTNSSGWLAYRFEINSSGEVSNIQVVSASEQDLFGPPSLAALTRWRYVTSEKSDRIGCALFLFQNAAAPINVSTLARDIGSKLDCGREAVHMLVPGSSAVP